VTRWWRLLAGAAVLVSGVGACSGSDDGAIDDPTTTLATPGPAPEAPAGWEAVRAPATCRCSDGSPYHFWVQRGDPSKLLFYLEGGGACFSAGTCGPEAPTFQRSLPEPGAAPASAGVFDADEARNPFAGWSTVYVPYCTGDLHLGDRVQDYGDGVVTHHNGAVNASTALGAAAATFPEATEVVVAGSSAGSAAAPLYGGLAHDVLPEARITVVADASASYPRDETVTSAIGGLWGAFDRLPGWPTSAGEPATAWSLPGLFVRAGRHVPGIRMATIDHAQDEVQARFNAVIGQPGDVGDRIVDNLGWIEDQGVELSSWLSGGSEHALLASDRLYRTRAGGVALHDWLSDLVAGEDVADVGCEHCR
jgi:hypothetical protein